MWNAIWDRLTRTGGLLRVRAVLALTLTGVGGAYMLLNQAMPPGEYNVLWAMSVTHYYATRGGEGSREP